MFNLTDLQHTFDENQSDYGPVCLAAAEHTEFGKDFQTALETFFSETLDLLNSSAVDRDKYKSRAEELYGFVLKAEEALKNGATLVEVKTILDPLIVQEKTPEQEKENAEIDRLEAEALENYNKLIAELEAKRADINK